MITPQQKKEAVRAAIEKIPVEYMREFPDNRTDENIMLAKKINEIIDLVLEGKVFQHHNLTV